MSTVNMKIYTLKPLSVQQIKFVKDSFTVSFVYVKVSGFLTFCVFFLVLLQQKSKAKREGQKEEVDMEVASDPNNDKGKTHRVNFTPENSHLLQTFVLQIFSARIIGGHGLRHWFLSNSGCLTTLK